MPIIVGKLNNRGKLIEIKSLLNFPTNFPQILNSIFFLSNRSKIPLYKIHQYLYLITKQLIDKKDAIPNKQVELQIHYKCR